MNQHLGHSEKELNHENKQKGSLPKHQKHLLMKQQQLVEFLIINLITRTFKQNPQITPDLSTVFPFPQYF